VGERKETAACLWPTTHEAAAHVDNLEEQAAMSGPASQRLRPFKPQRFGRYTLLTPISTGGMGEIFLARLEGAHGFDKLCVIKKILPHLAQDPEFVERFVDEARILVKLSHGNIAQVLDMGVEEGAPYIALEFIDGKDLRRVIARMRERSLQLPLSFILYTMTRVLDALAYAHRKRGDDDRELNLVHRDVSPQNVLISYEGEVKVIDFGLAKSTLSASKTNPSIIMGKFRYMSPEQARHKQVDRRSDLYAVGLCLFELVAGKNPFDDVPPGELMSMVASPQVPLLHQLDPLCPFGLSEAVARALDPDPAKRFQTAEEFRAKLLSLLLEIDPAAGPETTARFMREAFAIEHHAERKMLALVKEQAQALTPDEVTSTTTPALPEETLEGPRPTPLAMPSAAMETLDDPSFEALSAPARPERREPPQPAPAPAPAAALPPRPERKEAPIAVAPGDSLSFQPTRKGGPVKGADVRKRPEAPTTPSIVVGDQTGRDFMPTDAMVPVVAEPPPGPSIVVDDALAAPPPPARKPRPATAQTARPRSKSPAAAAPEKKKEPKAPVPSPPPPRELPVAAPPPPMEPKKGGVAVWLVLPLLAVLAVGGYIGWDVYTEQLKAKAIAEEHAPPEEPPAVVPDRATREVKVEPVAHPTPTPSDDDDLQALVPTDAGPRAAVKRPAVVPKPTASPGELALKALRVSAANITDENVIKPFKLKINKLENELATRGSDPAYVEQVKKLQADLEAAGRKAQ
jgi:serine/threonine-protein kinase